jgi:H+/gluconate symporter-like permease
VAFVFEAELLYIFFFGFLVAFGVHTQLGFFLLYFVAFCRRGVVRSFDAQALVLDAPAALGALVY